jgi:hypothetical protein
MTTHAEFRAANAAVMEELEAYVATLDAEMMTVPADAGGWNVRDHLAHLCAWESMVISALNGEDPWDGLGIDEALYRRSDYDACNAVLREYTINLSPYEVLDMLRETNEALLASIERIPEAQLDDPSESLHPAWEPGKTIAKAAAEDAHDHMAVHLTWMRAIAPGTAG